MQLTVLNFQSSNVSKLQTFHNFKCAWTFQSFKVPNKSKYLNPDTLNLWNFPYNVFWKFSFGTCWMFRSFKVPKFSKFQKCQIIKPGRGGAGARPTNEPVVVQEVRQPPSLRNILNLWNFETFETLKLWNFWHFEIWNFETFIPVPLKLWNFSNHTFWMFKISNFETLKVWRVPNPIAFGIPRPLLMKSVVFLIKMTLARKQYARIQNTFELGQM